MLRMSVLLTLVLAGTHALAFESLYVVNNQVGKSQAQIGFALQNSQYDYNTNTVNQQGRGTGSANVWNLGFNHSFSDVTSLQVGTSFANNSLTNAQSNQSFTSAGLGNININFKTGTVFKAATLTYGANSSLSPGPAEDASSVFNKQGLVNNSLGNNFTGYNTLSPFIGSESYIGETAVGVSTSLDMYTQQTKADNNGKVVTAQGSKTGLGLNGFVEIPLFKNVDAGISTGVKRTDMNLAQIFNRQEGSLFNSEIYSNLRYDKDTMISVKLTAEEDRKLDHENTNAFGVTLKRSL